MSPRTRLVIAVVSTGMVSYLAIGSVLGRVMGDSTYGQLSVFNEVVRLVIDSYVEPVNLDRAMDGAYRGLGDALDGESAYLDPATYKAYLDGKPSGPADVGLVLTRRFSFLMVVSPVAGSPAEKAGLRPGDVLKTIDGKHSRALSIPAGQSLLQGAPGSTLKLQILRSGSDVIDISLVRERLSPSAPRSERLDGGTAVIRVSEFSERTADEIRSELDGLRRAGARAIALDVRGAARGPLEQGPAIAQLFLKSGVLSKKKSRRAGDQIASADPGKSAWHGPVAILTSRGSAGAAEVLAAAILGAGRGEVIGEHTFGIAAVQLAFPMPEGGLLLTVAKYLTPKGQDIHGKGVKPSLEVDTAEAPAGEDLILKKALEVLAAGEVR